MHRTYVQFQLEPSGQHVSFLKAISVSPDLLIQGHAAAVGEKLQSTATFSFFSLT